MPADFGEALSERELEIVSLVAQGLTNREIAVRVYLSPNTVKVHLRNIFSKTGGASRTERTMLAVKEGWVAVAPMLEPAPSELQYEDDAAATAAAPVQTAPSTPPWPRARWIGLTLGLLL